jgi:hypothetical protein
MRAHYTPISTGEDVAICWNRRERTVQGQVNNVRLCNNRCVVLVHV